MEESMVAYPSDNRQGVIKSSLLFASSRASSPAVGSSYKELLAHPFLDSVQPPPDRAWQVSGPHGPRGPGSSLQTLVRPRGRVGGHGMNSRTNAETRLVLYVPRSPTV